jgi:hypothetical protein
MSRSYHTDLFILIVSGEQYQITKMLNILSFQPYVARSLTKVFHSIVLKREGGGGGERERPTKNHTHKDIVMHRPIAKQGLGKHVPTNTRPII